MKKCILLLSMILLAEGALQGQAPCNDSDKLSDCLKKMSNPPVVAPQDNEQVNQANRRRPSPPDTLGGATASSVKDFLPPLAVVVQSVNLDQKGQQLVIDFNLPAKVTPKNIAVQLQSIIRQPQIYDPVQKKITAAQSQAFAAKLNDLDDVTALLTLGLQNMHFGRRLLDSNDIFSDIFEALQDKGAEDVAKRRADDCNRLAPEGDPTFGDLSLEAKEACSGAALALGAVHAQLQNALRRIKIENLADLLNNQPQALLAINRRNKNELVGPNETSLDLSCELGFSNLNTLRQKLQDIKEENPSVPERASKLIAAFREISQRAKSAGRAKLEAQYKKIDRYTLVRSAESLNVKQPGATRWMGSFTYGKPLLFDRNGMEIGRIDAALRYENFSDDPDHRGRGIASFTYTQKLSDTFSFPVGLAYANHERFLSDVQRRFSAHFGLKMKLFGNS